jgi:hypothetical protein
VLALNLPGRWWSAGLDRGGGVKEGDGAAVGVDPAGCDEVVRSGKDGETVALKGGTGAAGHTRLDSARSRLPSRRRQAGGERRIWSWPITTGRRFHVGWKVSKFADSQIGYALLPCFVSENLKLISQIRAISLFTGQTRYVFFSLVQINYYGHTNLVVFLVLCKQEVL